ncbi:efflux RND transporter permease subunit [Candidatus Pacebacteria bacterium]|nr:efflux RND transporter permease subunit [Candidatus Paceibacterota bacterium]
MKNNFWTFFIDNFRLTYIIVAGLILFGLFSVTQIPKESSPEIDIPIMVITTQLPGASSEDVEELVTNKIEAKLQGLTELDEVTSVSGPGLSQITVSFDIDADSREKFTDVTNKLNGIGVDLPEDATDPVVYKISFNDIPIVTFSLSGAYPLDELSDYAEEIENKLERIGFVSEVNVIGAPEKQIEVVLSPELLEQYNLSASQITNSISQSNIDIPIGSIETANEVYTLRFAGRLENDQDIRDVSISSIDGVPVKLSDVAEINTVFNKGNSLARFGKFGSESEQAIFIDVYKQSGEGDIISIIKEAKEEVKALQVSDLPEDLFITDIKNDGDLIKEDLTTLLSSGAFTVIIIFFVLVLFLGWREAVLASMVVPLTFLIALIAIWGTGFTINFLTLFSLILALGILVDASIVVTEGIFERSKTEKDIRTAALKTIEEFQKPLVAGTLTTIFVFLPMMLMSGIMGKFIESIPVTVTIVLLAALLVALGFVTTFATRFLKDKKNIESGGGLQKLKDLIQKTYVWYGNKISTLLGDRKKSKRFLKIIVALFFLSLATPVVGIVKVEMFPDVDMDSVSLNIESPIGTSLAITNEIAEDVESILREDRRIENFVTKVGSGSNDGSLGGFSQNSHKVGFIINLSDKRKEGSQEIITEYEKILNDRIDADISIGQEESGPEQGSPIQINLTGDILSDLDSASLIISDELSDTEGTRNIKTGIDEGNGEFVVEINRAQARSYGITELQVAQALRTAISGFSATTIQKNGEDIDVIVTSRLGQDAQIGNISQASVEDINSISVLTNRGPIPISVFGEVKISPSRSSISHKSNKRIVIVSAEGFPGVNTQSIVRDLERKISNGELELPESVSVSFGGESEDIKESFTSLGLAMIVGILMIIGLLVWQFNSYRQPILVVITIPLALIGVFAGLAISGQPLSFPGFIGVVALSGIVVNNAIILIDSINSNRRAGQEKVEAIISSAKSRLQPIILTTITTVAGLLPLALGDPSWAPLAVSIVFGLLFSTVLTLFVLPITYMFFAEKELH